MKTISKKIGLEKQNIKNLSLFTRAKIGTHLGMLLDEGKDNSVIIGITHSDILPEGIKTVGCEFSSLAQINPYHSDTIKKNESRAVLTIVNNKTLQFKNQKILSKLIYQTGLINHHEQEKLKTKILLKNKITYLSNTYRSEDTHILYQTKTKTEAVSLNNRDRLIELIGVDMYDRQFAPLVNLYSEIGEQKIPIADILKDKIGKEGIEGVMKILDKITWH